MRWLTLSFLALFLVAVPCSAVADAPPDDVSLVRFEFNTLRPAPPGYVEREDGNVRWEYPREAAAIVNDLATSIAQEWPRIERELGAHIDDSLLIRIGRNPEEMAALSPANAPPPPYAVGVAYPTSGLVLLTLSAPETWERPDVARVLTHELSHIALHRAVNAHPVPRWMMEGLAIHQARERSLERMQTLWEATVRGRLISLDDLSQRFPNRPEDVDIAYAESADFVEWLGHRGSDPNQFPELIARLGAGQSLETAVSQTFSAGIGQLEYAWREQLSERYGTLPLLLGTAVIWMGIAALVVMAWFRRRAESRQILNRWELEEAQILTVPGQRSPGHIPSVIARGSEYAASSVAESAPTESASITESDSSTDRRAAQPVGGAAHSLVPGENGGAHHGRPDTHVPTVVWEGRSHTLH